MVILFVKVIINTTLIVFAKHNIDRCQSNNEGEKESYNWEIN